MNLLIISSSQRVNSQSAKVAEFTRRAAEQFESVSHIELANCQLDYWDGSSESLSDSRSDKTSSWPFINQKMSRADAFVLITPEWGGMASPLLKNLLLMSEAQHCAHKPVLLISVSSGIGGSYPIAELKLNAFKNNKMLPTPDHLIVRNVEQVLNESQVSSTLSDRDKSIRLRLDYSLSILSDYAAALKPMRIKQRSMPFANEQNYIYGM